MNRGDWVIRNHKVNAPELVKGGMQIWGRYRVTHVYDRHTLCVEVNGLHLNAACEYFQLAPKCVLPSNSKTI